MRHVLTVCLGAMLLGMLCSVPVAADVPTDIVDQYWVWYPAQVPGAVPGYWVGYINDLQVAAPEWSTCQTQLVVNNIEMPNRIKNVWVEIKYVKPQTKMSNLLICDPRGNTYAPEVAWISSNGQFLTWKWTLPWQPACETILFGSTDFYNLKGIELLEVGTQCVPEPAGIALLVSGLIGCGFLRKRR